MNKQKVFQWMFRELVWLPTFYQYVDSAGEINTTKLAENAAEHFDLYVDHLNYEIPEDVFELAGEVKEYYLESGK